LTHTRDPPLVKAISSAKEGGKDSGEGFSGTADGEGFTGLKSLGVRDLSYKLCFLACAVHPLDNNKVIHAMMIMYC
jgi:hypothetical protein